MTLTRDQKTNEKHELIKARLRINGTSFARIARQLDVSDAAISLVSSGKHRSKKIERAIASALKSQPEIIWPERYNTVQERGGEDSM